MLLICEYWWYWFVVRVATDFDLLLTTTATQGDFHAAEAPKSKHSKLRETTLREFTLSVSRLIETLILSFHRVKSMRWPAAMSAAEFEKVSRGLQKYFLSF